MISFENSGMRTIELVGASLVHLLLLQQNIGANYLWTASTNISCLKYIHYTKLWYTPKNIAKGTRDPRVEFCLPKVLILVISQGQAQNLIIFIFRILTKHQLLNLDISKHKYLD